MLLHLTQMLATHRSKPSDYPAVLGASIVETDKTCGGLPTYKAPRDYSLGVKCKTDADCTPEIVKVQARLCVNI